MSQSTLTFLKLGGSLITDKSRAYTARREIIVRLADEVRQALGERSSPDAAPDLNLLIGHGSGSFGHWAAKLYGTRQGVRTAAQWRGYAEVAASAARLNRIVTDAFLDAGVPVLSVQPSASAHCHDYVLKHLDTRPIHAALAQGLVPLVYGDIALDDVHGGTIISTEDIFLYLADELHPSRILLLGEVAGVLDQDGTVIPHITPADLPPLHPRHPGPCTPNVQGGGRRALGEALGGSEDVDVTGGMVDKVARMVELVQRHPSTHALIFTGTEPGLLRRVLRHTTAPPLSPPQAGGRLHALPSAWGGTGTLITA